jgi:hypothetical protein
MTRKAALIAAALAIAGVVDLSARADPYRLRADAYATAPDPAGFLMVQAEASERTAFLFDAEALVWTGVFADKAPTLPANGADARGEVVIASVRLRDVERGLELRFGRLLYQGGAIRPLHLDGAVATIRAPTGATLELFGGIPVLPDWQGRSFDWVVGGRTTQAISNVASIGYSYWQERQGGVLSHSELGFDASVTPSKILVLSSTAAIDTERFGLAEARVSAIIHGRSNRLELFGVRRSPSRLLPATSLFAALGSFDADELGLAGFWRAAPRLDLSATATVDRVADLPGTTQTVRAELRLDDEGRGSIGLEGSRFSMPSGSWTGMRAFARLPIAAHLAGSSEVEVAIPDDSRGRGFAWPWALISLRYEPVPFLSIAAAFEASSTPAYQANVGGLLHISGTWSKE